MSFSRGKLSDVPTYQWTASEMMGACGSGPAAGVENGLACNRSTDVWGIALDNHCQLEVTWPAVGGTKGPPDPPNSTANAGTYEATQSLGPTVCGQSATAGASLAIPPQPPLPNTSAAAGAPYRAWPYLAVALALLLLLRAWRKGRRRV